jgi:hypothetical protein
MKKRNIVSTLALTLAIGMGVTAYAASSDSTATTSQQQRLGLGKITSMRGYEYVSNILKSKLGLSDSDIINAKNSGKTLYDLATEKGMTQDQLKEALLQERTKAIDTAMTNGTITKEESNTLKANLNTNMENCTENFGQGQSSMEGQNKGQGRNQGRGMMEKGQGRFK